MEEKRKRSGPATSVLGSALDTILARVRGSHDQNPMCQPGQGLQLATRIQADSLSWTSVLEWTIDDATWQYRHHIGLSAVPGAPGRVQVANSEPMVRGSVAGWITWNEE